MPKYINVDGHKAVIAKGSSQNDGRRIAVWHEKINGEWKTKSKNLARVKYENATGKDLSKDTHVDHKDNNSKNDSSKNLRATSAKENIGKENKRRAK